MAKHGKVGVTFKPGQQSILVLKADSTTPFPSPITDLNVLANSASTGAPTSFWTPTVKKQTLTRIVIQLIAVAVPAVRRRPEDGTDTPTGDITVVLNPSAPDPTTVLVKNFTFLSDG
jgi:hypothetical protein